VSAQTPKSQATATPDTAALAAGATQKPAGVIVRATELTKPPVEPPAPDHALASLPGPVEKLSRPALLASDAGPSLVAKTDIVSPLALSDLRVKRDTVLNGAPATFTSAVADPSVGSIGQAIFQTYNWYAARSLDNGATWSYVDPYTTFPTIGNFSGGFCCNQRVTQDPARDLMIWSLQYNKTSSTSAGTNGIRIAVAHGASDIASNTWQVHDFTPGDFNPTYAQGYWFDFPGLAVSGNYLYFTYNIFTTTTDTWTAAVIGRVPLAALSNNTAFTLDTFVTTSPGHFTITPVSGATNRMFFGAVSTQSTITVFEWPESTTTVTQHTVSGLNSTYFFPVFARPTCPAFDLTDPCMNGDSRMQTGWVNSTELGFAWASSQNAATGRPYPFARVAILNPNAPATVLSQPDLWNTNFAYMYPALALNDRGHVGGAIDALGGSQGTSVASTLLGLVRDDYSAGGWATVAVATSNAGTPSRWGNYNGSAHHDVYGNTWLIAGKVQMGGTSDANSRVHNAWIMRDRDDPFPFTDDPLVIGVTMVRAVHFLELRTRIDQVRAARGLPAFSWSNDLAVGTTIRAAHIVELREALRQAYVAASTPPPTYSDPALAAGTMIRAVHIRELRSAVLDLQ
jgi:hypothetical protein